MRTSLLLIGSVSLSAVVAVVACGDSGLDSTFPGQDTDAGGSSGSSGCFGACNSEGGTSGGAPVVVTSMRIDPPDATITVAPGAKATQAYKVLAKVKGAAQEQDITARSVFYVPDDFLVGTFPANGAPTFTTRLPVAVTDPPQRGGKLTVQAQAANSDGTLVTVTTSLTVKLSATSLDDPTATPAIPANPGAKFAGTLSATRSPGIVYPNDGVMLPPNLQRLDIHWDPGAGNDLFQLRFVGTNSNVTYYTRCDGGSAFVAGKCGFQLDQTAYAYIAATNNGGSVKLTIRGTDEAGAATYGESQELTMNFAQNNVDGGLYYWTISDPPRILRVDFGNPNATLEEFLVPSTNGLTNQCVGCHTLSRDGTKLVASVGGQWDGRLVYLNDLSKAKGSTGWLQQNGDMTGPPAQNRVQFASFNPSGSQFVAVYGDTTPGPDGYPQTLLPTGSDIPANYLTDRNKLFFHDGTTGLRTSSMDMPFRPDHPDWSPDGQMIAMTTIPATAPVTTSTQRPTRGGLSLIKQAAGKWQSPITLVASADGKNRLNPSFVPDSSFLLFTESTCPAGQPDSTDCDGDSDPSAKTFAMKPAAGATPILLARAATPGVADGALVDTGDTFPRATPFQTKHNGGTLMWTTVASRRAPGYRTKGGEQLLWMYAIDPAKVAAGADGSYPAFFLPFQDFTTSNHIAQWTQKIVGGNTPPPPVPPAPPPAPPVPR